MTMFELFPGNYRWSYNTWAALAAGGEFGDLGLILDRLRASEGRDETWYEAWTWLADLLERRAEENLSVGTKASAAENYFLASLYHKIAEQFVPPADPLRLQSYGRALGTFEKARTMSDHGIERVLVPYEWADLAGLFHPGPQQVRSEPDRHIPVRPGYYEGNHLPAHPRQACHPRHQLPGDRHPGRRRGAAHRQDLYPLRL